MTEALLGFAGVWLLVILATVVLLWRSEMLGGRATVYTQGSPRADRCPDTIPDWMS